jgi:hypothetical protein
MTKLIVIDHELSVNMLKIVIVQIVNSMLEQLSHQKSDHFVFGNSTAIIMVVDWNVGVLLTFTFGATETRELYKQL